MGKVTSERNHRFDMVGDSRVFNNLSEPGSPSSFLRSEKHESTQTRIGSRTQQQDPAHKDDDRDLNRIRPQSSLVNEKFRFPEAINRGGGAIVSTSTDSCLNSNESTVNKVFRTNVTSRRQTEEKRRNRAAAACAKRADPTNAGANANRPAEPPSRAGIGIVLRKIPTASSATPTVEDTNGPRTTAFSRTSATTGTLEFADQNRSNNKNIIRKIAKHDMQHETDTTRSMPPIMMSPISAAATYTSPTPGLNTMGSDLSASSETAPSVSLSSVPLSPSGVVPDAFNSSTCDSRTCGTAPTTPTTPAMQAPFSRPMPNAAAADRCQDPGGADLEGGRDGCEGGSEAHAHAHAHSLDFEDAMGPSAVVHDAARVLDWSRVMELCGESPLDAGYRGTDGWFALHFACNRRPPSDVVESLVRAHPDAVFMRDTNKGMTPLHYACRFKASREVVRLLLQAAAASSSSSAGAEAGEVLTEARRVENACRLKCKLGRTPLYYATRYDAPEGVMQMLLEAYPTGAIDEDRKGETPLRLVWDKYATTLAGKRSISDFFQRVGVVSTSLGHEPTSASPPNFKGKTANPIVAVASADPTFNYREASRRLHLLKKDAKLFAKFQAADMLLRAAHYGCRQRSQDKKGSHGEGEVETEPFQPNANQFRFVLHAIADVGCHVHPTLWELARCVFPHQLALPDDRARMPLHYAVACTACRHSDHSWLCPMSRSAAGARRSAARAPASSTASSASAAPPNVAALGGSGGGLVNAAVERPVLAPSASSASVVASAPTSSASEEILHELIELYPKAASCRDADGVSPLTLAMENTCHDFSWYASSGSEPSESAMAATNVEEAADVDIFAAVVPSSVSTRGPEDGILRKLLMASPTVLYAPDPRTRLYPFMTAAADARSRHSALQGSSGGSNLTGDGDKDAEKLTIVYELIRMLPERIHDALR